MTTDLDRLVAAFTVHPWCAVVVRPGQKRPHAFAKGDPWLLTTDPRALRWWVGDPRGNLGLMGGEPYGLCIIDVDDPAGFARLVTQLGPLAPTPTVVTASGKAHYYVQWMPGIPSVLVGLEGEVIGEPRRGALVCGQDPQPQQMAVCPPSRIGGRAYTFDEDVDLTAPLPAIPPTWRDYFHRMTAKASVPSTPRTPAPPRALVPEDDDPLFLAAIAQPGATRRGDDVKFQCPACAVLGRDTHQDNARFFFRTGGWGCATFPKGVPGSLLHWQAIGIALGQLDTDGSPRRFRVTR